MSLRRLAILPALGLALATVNVACQKKSEPPKDDMTPTQRPMGVPAGGERPSMEQVSMVQPVTIREQAQGQNLELNDPLPTVYLFTNRTQLEAAGGDELLDEMKVNFKRHSLVLAYLGEQTSGGYWARIDRVYSVGDVLHADVTVNRPGDDQMSTMALTHPYAAAVIDKADASTVTPHWKQVAGQAMEGSGGGMQEEGMDEVKEVEAMPPMPPMGMPLPEPREAREVVRPRVPGVPGVEAADVRDEEMAQPTTGTREAAEEFEGAEESEPAAGFDLIPPAESDEPMTK